MSCVEQNPALEKYSSYPELFLVDHNFGEDCNVNITRVSTEVITTASVELTTGPTTKASTTATETTTEEMSTTDLITTTMKITSTTQEN